MYNLEMISRMHFYKQPVVKVVLELLFHYNFSVINVFALFKVLAIFVASSYKATNPCSEDLGLVFAIKSFFTHWK